MKSQGISLILAAAMAALTVFATPAAAQNDPEWTTPFPPFRIAGNLYYVGSKGLASYLITTPQGHILINSNLVESVPMIRASVEKLGFKFSDIRILLINQAHWDHNAGSAAIKAQTGASYMVMDADVSAVESGGKTDFHYANDKSSLYPASRVDRVLRDGEEVSLGGTTLVARLTPGHTKGCTTWTMKVTDGGKTYNVVFVGGTSVNPGYKLVNNPQYPQIAADYERTFKVLHSLPVDIFLGAHGVYFDMEKKVPLAKPGAANPFIDSQGYTRYVAVAEKAFLAELAKQRAARQDDSAAVVESSFVFETAPFASAHASTIVETGDGLVSAWFGGTREGAADVGIWLARKSQGAWTSPTEVATGVQADGVRHPCWNPVLFQARDGTLMLFYKVGPSPQTWWGLVRTSRDNGRTWSEARRLPDGILGPIKNKPIELTDGTLLAPSSSETPTQPSVWRIHFERSTDGGATWTRTAPPPGETPIDAIQPSVLVHPGGRLQALGRTRSQRVFETWSSDGGRTWTPVSLTELPNPSAGTDAVTLRDGRHLLVYNHTPKGRSPLNVAMSRDGKAWTPVLVLEDAPGEYSYPAVIQAADGKVHIVYTWRRERIKHVVVDPD